MTPQRHFLADRAPGLSALPAVEHRRVLSAVTEAFLADGYAACTAEQLQLRIYPRIFDSLFLDKEDCFLQVFDLHTSHAREQITASAPIDDPWPDRLAAGLWALLEAIDAQPSAARLVLVEAQVATPVIARRFFNTLYSTEPFMREGRLLADASMPALADRFLPAGVASALTAHLRARREAPVSSLYGELLRLLLLYYRDNPEVADHLATRTLREAA